MKRKIFIIHIVFIILSCTYLPYFSFATETIIESNIVENAEYKITEYQKPRVNSEAALLIDLNTRKVLFDKNSTERMYPASTTKIMTAILALENCDLHEMATVSKNAISMVPSGYTTAKLVAGEKMSIEDLLYGLMLNSANEAANVLAEHISGSVEEFAKLMNAKSTELGCTNTHFLNANGMHNDNHYSTAEDLATIAIYCMKNEKFRKIVSTVEYTLPSTNLYTKNDRVMKNTNMLITPSSQYYYEYAIGIKTGFTSQAGNCLVSWAEKDGRSLVCVTLKAGSTTGNSSYRFTDSKALLEYGFEAYSYQDIIQKDSILDTIQVENATKETKYLKLITDETVSDLLSNNLNLSEIEPEIQLRSEITAPVKKGEKLGTITYTIDGTEYTSNIVAESNVEKNINFISYSFIAGFILLVAGIFVLLSKRKSKE